MNLNERSQHHTSQPSRPHSRQAQVEDVVNALRGYGILTLTRARLAEVCGVAHCSDPAFGRALHASDSAGTVRRLSQDVYGIADAR
jgi:hypothetical protein